MVISPTYYKNLLWHCFLSVLHTVIPTSECLEYVYSDTSIGNMDHAQEDQSCIIVSSDEEPLSVCPPLFSHLRGGCPARRCEWAYWQAVGAGKESEYPYFMAYIRKNAKFPRHEQHIPVDFSKYYLGMMDFDNLQPWPEVDRTGGKAQSEPLLQVGRGMVVVRDRGGPSDFPCLPHPVNQRKKPHPIRPTIQGMKHYRHH